MKSAKQRLRESIEQLSEQQAFAALELVRRIITTPYPTEPDLAAFGVIPPSPDATPFKHFEPVEVSGKSISEMLLADRR